MSPDASRRRVLVMSGLLFGTSVSGCVGDFGTLRQPYGDLSIRNDDSRSHEVIVEAPNHHVIAREGEDRGTKHLELVIEVGTSVYESRYFEAGRTDVSVSVNGSLVEEVCLENWRGEGGDEDRHEESIEVTIRENGSAEIEIHVAHTVTSQINFEGHGPTPGR